VSLDEKALRADLKKAMLARDAVRTRVARGVIAAVKNRMIELKSTELPENEILTILKREAKQRTEALEFARKAQREETVAELQAEMAVLEDYLPKQLGEPELRAAIETIAKSTGASSIGPVMKELSSRYPGRFDGKLASRLASEILGS